MEISSYPSPRQRSTQPPECEDFERIGDLAAAVAISAARRAIHFHRERAAKLTGRARQQAIREANSIAIRAGLCPFEGELEAA